MLSTLFARIPHPTERIATLERLCAELIERMNKLEHLVNRTQSATLAAEIHDLRNAFQTSIATNRREFGKLWGRIGADAPPRAADDDADDELKAFIELQRAK